jgi:hypothetical protein
MEPSYPTTIMKEEKLQHGHWELLLEDMKDRGCNRLRE